jgi:CHAT domain-containing protein
MKKLISVFSLLVMLLTNAVAIGQPAYSVKCDNGIQVKLLPDEVILFYRHTDSVLLVTAVDHWSEVEATIITNNLFWESLNAYRKKIKSADLDNFFVYSKLLYSFLVGPVQNFLKNKHRLIIVPDQVLAEIPFEALIPDSFPDNKGTSKIPRFLIHDFEVVYRRAEVLNWGDRTDLFDFYPKKGNQNPYAFIGFSSDFTNHSSIGGLPETRKELKLIGSMFETNGLPARLVEGGLSGKDHFKRMADSSSIIHLATHYFNGSDIPFHNGFLFWDDNSNNSQKTANEEVLTIEEICNLQFHADLVVLSACASGMERLQSGKYRNAVPEIFLIAGAQNILSTLWNVTDRVTVAFMVDFYGLLLSGKSYSAALREVKLQMLRCRETSLPTVWAPYILTER